MKVKGYDLDNEDKVKRAMYGSIGKGGELYGGVGEDAPEEVLLAAYDRLHGRISKKGNKVKNGCFFDAKQSKIQKKPVPVENPEVKFVFQVGNEEIEVPEGEALPLDALVAKKLDDQRKAKRMPRKGRRQK